MPATTSFTNGSARYVFPVCPIGKPRMTQRDRWKGRDVVQKYYAYKDEVIIWASKYHYVLEGTLSIRFYLPMPESWSKKKRSEMVGKPHTQKPDIDNLVKAFLDAMTYHDEGVWSVDAKKYWDSEGRIEIC